MMPVPAKSEISNKRCKYSVFLGPDGIWDLSESDVFSWTRPSDGMKSLLLSTNKGEIKELVAFKEPHRSWFVDQEIESDGSLRLITDFDPVFMVLPLLRKSEKKVPLDHLVDEQRLLQSKDLRRRLPSVATQKGNPDLDVWEYDSSKTLEYLKEKVHAIVETISSRSIHIDSSFVQGYTESSNKRDTQEILAYAWGLLSFYLESDLSLELKASLGIKTEESSKKRSSSSTSEGISKKPRKSSGPVEDYFLSSSQSTDSSGPKTAKQKALARSASGSKNITSFFKKS